MLGGAAAVSTARAVAAQQAYPAIRVTGSMQVQGYYYDRTSFAPDSGLSDFFLRRARIEAEGEINEYVKVKIQPSYEGGRGLVQEPTVICGAAGQPCTVTGGRTGFRLRDAFIDVALFKPASATNVVFRFGQEKRPFNRYSLTSSRNLPSIERGAGQGLPGLQAFDLANVNGFSEHDIGVSTTLTTALAGGRRVTLKAAAYNGEGETVLRDRNNAKSFGFRATVDVWRKLNVGASYFSHDNPNLAAGRDSTYRNTAWGVDGQWGKPGDAGLFVLADYFQGRDLTKAARRILGFGGVAAYHFRVRRAESWLYAIEPMVRWDVGNLNRDISGAALVSALDNKYHLFTAGVGLYLASKAQFRIAYEQETAALAGSPTIRGVRSAMTVNW
jgi:hypothetical protein